MSSKAVTIETKQDGHENSLVPKLRFQQFRQHRGWDAVPGNIAFEQISNKNAAPGLPVLAITQEHGAIPRDLIDYHVSVSEQSLTGYKVVEVGDFIISLRSFQGGIEYSKYKGICSPAYIILRSKEREAVLYFRHYFKTEAFIRDLNKNIEGIRDGKMVSWKQFSDLHLPVPSLPEQLLVAECLSSIDELIAAERRKLDTVKAHKRGLMQRLFPAEGEAVPRLRFPEFLDADDWILSPLAELAENLDNRRIPVTAGERVRGSIPYYGASGIIDYIDTFIFDEPLLCVSEDGANLKDRTYPIAFSISGKTWVNNHAHVLRFADLSAQKMVQVYLNSNSIEDFLTGMAQPKLNRAMLDSIPIPLPKDDDERRTVASCLSLIDDVILQQDLRLQKLVAHKQALMQRLFPALDEVEA